MTSRSQDRREQNKQLPGGMRDHSTPNFFIVGAPKSGTTSMNDYLRQHSEVFMPAGKEFHYFGSDIKTKRARCTLDEYLAQFASVQNEMQIGESSVWYLYSEMAAQEINDFCPAARIIVMLRNPVDMLYSQHSEFLFNGNEEIASFEAALDAEEDRKQGRRFPSTAFYRESLFYRETVRYADQLKRYFDVFGRDAVHVIIFDDFKTDTRKAYSSALSFLGVDPTFKPKIQILNQNKVRRRLPNFVHRRAPDLVPQRFRLGLRRFLKARHTPRPPMNPETRKSLQREFKHQIEELGDVLGRDLSCWIDD